MRRVGEWFKRQFMSAPRFENRDASFAELAAPGVQMLHMDRNMPYERAIDETIAQLSRYGFDREEVRRLLRKRFEVSPFSKSWLAEYKHALAGARACQK